MNEPPGARNRVLTATGAVGRSVQAGDPRNTGGQPVCRATSEFWSYDSAGEYAGWPRVRRLAPSPPAGPESAGWPRVRRLAPSPPAGPESAGWPRVRRPPRLAIRGDRARPGDHRRVSPPVAVVPRRRSRVRLGAGSKGVRAAARAWPSRLAIRGDRARPGDHRRVSPPVAVVPRRRSRVRLGAGSKGVRAAARARPSRLAIRGDRARPGDHRRVSPLPASRRGDDHRTPGPTIEQPGPRQASAVRRQAPGRRSPDRPDPPRPPAREPGR